MTEMEPAHESARYLGPEHWTPAEWRWELERGLRFTHVMMSVTQDQGNEAVAYAQALADVLSEKGLIRPEELESPLERARQEVAKVVLPRVRLAEMGDKYADGQTVTIHCAELIPFCHGRCCTLRFYLSKQDLSEGAARWDYGNPYWIAQGADGFCVHSDPQTRACTIHAQRPHVCRKYDCRQDKRIWQDFERRIPAEPLRPHGRADIAMMENALQPTPIGTGAAAEEAVPDDPPPSVGSNRPPTNATSSTFTNAAAHLIEEWDWLAGALALAITTAGGGQGMRSAGVPTAEALRERRHILDRAVQSSLAAGVNLPIVHLAYRLSLSRVEIQSLLLAAACEMHGGFRQSCATLQGETVEPGPSLRLLHHLFAESERPLAFFVAEFTRSMLLHAGLARLVGTPLEQAVLRVDGRVLQHLFGYDVVEPAARSYLRVDLESDEGEDVRVWEALGERLAQPPADFVPGLLLQFIGRDDLPKRRAARAVARRLGRPLLCLDVQAAGGGNAENVAALAAREALLRQGCVLLEHWDAPGAEQHEGQAFRRELLRRLGQRAGIVFLLLDEAPSEALEWSKAILTYRFPALDFGRRAQVWERSLAAWKGGREELNAATLAGRFRFQEGQIAEVMRRASHRALARDPHKPFLTQDDIYAVCHEMSQFRLSGLVTRVPAQYQWDDLILPEDAKAQLHEMVERVNHSATVFGQWGFDRKVAYGKGVAALFMGPSGTGKTMAAQVIAGALHLELFKIHLAGVVSKYVGETEKNLERVFQEGQTTNAVLLFDEAEALFGKRSEARDAQDRFANIEIAYLLQRIEEYEGIAVLASNRKADIDEAFTRRLDFVVSFPQPDEEQRRRIWMRVFPAETALAGDVDLEFMARQFKITGGNIRNIALAAAFLAASDNSALSMRHLVWATRREYQKIGKLCTEAEFGPYYRWVIGQAGDTR